MKYIISLSLLLLLISCQSGQKKLTPCERYGLLSGSYSNYASQGEFTFIKGGQEGTIEITGVDYNEMTCNYVIQNCENGQANMNCDGSSFDTRIVVMSADSVEINNQLYIRNK